MLVGVPVVVGMDEFDLLHAPGGSGENDVAVAAVVSDAPDELDEVLHVQVLRLVLLVMVV